jgi:hypothetical protein
VSAAASQISQPLRYDPPAEPTFTPADRAICPPLSLEERARLRTLEQVIDRSITSFLECGRALSEVKSSRLYRESYPSWDAYVRDRWGLTTSRSQQLIAAVAVVENLSAADLANAALLASANEHELRPLAKLMPDLAAVCFELAKRIKAQPDSGTIQTVVDTIRDSIEAGWQQAQKEDQNAAGREQLPDSFSGASANGPESSAPDSLPPIKSRIIRVRRAGSDTLGVLCRFSNALGKLDPVAIALGDDGPRRKLHLLVRERLIDFCTRLSAEIRKLEDE